MTIHARDEKMQATHTLTYTDPRDTHVYTALLGMVTPHTYIHTYIP
jgi:hypothetical protein